ncbi:unnamed protein product [Heligmosomoides polygyrus]|uniref:Protein KRI1 homolog n=1 Tax=Heligmosomoides polygyrus TaxID=6339 RepID=A0A183GD78_HELPZ|nr:unnamed protein product [Heligmosomoides polygyrus]
MPKLKLIDSDDDDKDGATTSSFLEINKNYAERYDNWRRLEELQKIKDKYGDDINDTSSSEEEPEWSDTEEMQFLRTLSALKDKDNSIYDEKSQFWSEIDNLKSAPRLKKKKHVEEKPMYLKDYERKLVLEKEGLENVSDEDDDLLVPKVKTESEKVKEDNEFYSWMKSQDAKEISDEDSLKGLKKAWKDPNIDEGEKFLRDYILNKDFIPNEEDKGITIDDIQEIEEDEKLLDMQRNFEQKYNFRFEDPDQEFIKQYPRTVGESLRKTNMKRKEKREEYKERKEREKKERKQEIRELKKMKKAEIEKKLERLKRLAGDDIPINVDDLTGDFDPREYDKRMQQIFNEEYYGKDEEVCDENLEKPVFSDSDDSDSSDYDNFPIGSAHEETGVENDKSSTKGSAKRNEGNGEEARSPGRIREFCVISLVALANISSHRKRKRNSKFCEAVRREKPLFDPKEKTFEEYFNEYYALDYEDIIGDHLTRFRYRQVVPNDFGLSVGEILSADDRQLNAWASLKKATGYRSEHEELVELKRYKKKAADLKKKARIFNTDFGGQVFMYLGCTRKLP